jgi:tetratricopeptide (TPR) repeat protein
MEEVAGEARRSILDLIDAGRFDEAAEFARQTLEQIPDDPTLTMLRGLALVQAGRVDMGTSVLKMATELDPNNPEPFHNLAVALLNQGNAQEASTYAQEALRLDPEHEGAMRTLQACQAHPQEASFEASLPNSPRDNIESSAMSVRPGPDDLPVHILHLGEAWTYVGFVLCAYCIVSFTVLIFHPFVDEKGLRHESGAIVSFFLYVTSGLAAVIWTLIDIIDRREKFVWLLPMWVCGFAALPVLPLSLYLAFRKKMIQMP